MKIELKNVASVFNGKTPSKAEQRDVGFPVLKIKDIDENGLFKGKFDCFVDQELADGLLKKHLQVGDILILNAAHNSKYVGSKKCFVSEDFAGALATGEWTIVRPNQNKVLPKFLYFILDTAEFQFELQNVVKGIHLYPKDLNEIKIFCPPLEEQKRIVRELDAADALRQKRKQTIALLDDYLKAVFLEMFGDPVTNPKGWEVKKIDDFFRVQGGFAFKSEDYKQQGVKLVKIANVHLEDLIWDPVEYVPENFIEDKNEFLLKKGDFLIALTRPIIQSLGVVKTVTVKENDLPCLLNQRVARFLPKNELINCVYFKYFCYTQFFKKQVEYYSASALQPNISAKEIEEISILNAPIDLQKKFAVIVESVDFLMARMNVQVGELEANFNALMQNSFKV